MLALLLADVLPIDRNFDFSPDPGPYILVFGIGFVIAVLGHIAQSRWLIAAGILMIMLSTFLLPVAIYLSQGG
jgi:hypothetical protein